MGTGEVTVGTRSHTRWEQEKGGGQWRTEENGSWQLESVTSGVASILVTGGSCAEEPVSAISALLENEVQKKKKKKECPDRVSQTCAGDE